jgi:hypothetical protein
MQHVRQRLLWTRQWLSGVSETGSPPKEPEDPSDDTQAIGTETDTSFEIVSRKNNEDASNTDFGAISIHDSGPPTTKDLPSPPPSHCPSCGWPWPPPPPSSCSEPIPPQQPTQNLELAGRGDHSHVFSDLRSASLARQRDRSEREKYYGFRYVKRGELGSEGAVKRMCSRPCCGVEEEEEVENGHDYDDGGSDSRNSEDVSSRMGILCFTTGICSTERPPQSTTTTTANSPPPTTEEIDKHTLYRLAQLYPRPPKNHHRHIDKVVAPLSQRVERRRGERKHQKAILRDEIEDF